MMHWPRSNSCPPRPAPGDDSPSPWNCSRTASFPLPFAAGSPRASPPPRPCRRSPPCTRPRPQTILSDQGREATQAGVVQSLAGQRGPGRAGGDGPGGAWSGPGPGGLARRADRGSAGRTRRGLDAQIAAARQADRGAALAARDTSGRHPWRGRGGRRGPTASYAAE